MRSQEKLNHELTPTRLKGSLPENLDPHLANTRMPLMTLLHNYRARRQPNDFFT